MPDTNAASDSSWFNLPGRGLLELLNFTTSDALRRDVRRVMKDSRERRKLTVELLGSVRSIYRTGLVHVSPCAQAYRARGALSELAAGGACVGAVRGDPTSARPVNGRHRCASGLGGAVVVAKPPWSTNRGRSDALSSTTSRADG